MKATINKSGLDTEVSPIDGGKYYITQDGDVYRADEVTLGQNAAPAESEEHQVAIILSGADSEIKTLLCDIASLLHVAQSSLKAFVAIHEQEQRARQDAQDANGNE